MKKLFIAALSVVLVFSCSFVAMAYADLSAHEAGTGSVGVEYTIPSVGDGIVSADGEYNILDNLTAKANIAEDIFGIGGSYRFTDNVGLEVGYEKVNGVGSVIDGLVAANLPLSDGLYLQGRIGETMVQPEAGTDDSYLSYGGSIVYDKDAVEAWADVDMVDDVRNITVGGKYDVTGQINVKAEMDIPESGDNSTTVGGEYKVAENIKLGANYNIDSETWGIGAELSF
ncbi:MAG: hypothetical protein ACM3WV_06905 [Bacillota bacterium]